MVNKYPSNHNERRKELAEIHMLAAALGMDTADESETSEYRAMLFTLARQHSAAGMDWRERKQVLDHLRSLANLRGVRPSSKTKGRPSNLAESPQLKKIEALLADMKLPWAYLSASKKGPSMLKRLAGVDRIEWASAEGLGAVIAALARRQEKRAK